MRRIFLPIARRKWSIMLFLFLGVVMNLAIAWACALLSGRDHNIERGVPVLFTIPPPNQWQHDLLLDTDKTWLHTSADADNEFVAAHYKSFGLDRRAFQRIPLDSISWPGMPNGEMPLAVQTLAGWPLPCLWAEQWGAPPAAPAPAVRRPFPTTSAGMFVAPPPPGPPAPVTYQFKHAVVTTVSDRLASGGLAQRPLPTLVLWRGMVGNSMLFAALLWTLMLGPREVRRAMRARRGVCPACAYPVGTSPVCTECGGAVVARRVHTPLLTQRRLALAFGCLVLGTLSSVGFGWACALWSPIVVSAAEPQRIESEAWWTAGPSSVQPKSRGLGPGVEIIHFESGAWGCHIVRGGWPMLEWEHAVEFWDNGTNRSELAHRGYRLPRAITRSDWDRQYLPLRPIAPGIVLNIAVHGMIWWLAIAGARRWKRRSGEAQTAGQSTDVADERG